MYGRTGWVRDTFTYVLVYIQQHDPDPGLQYKLRVQRMAIVFNDIRYLIINDRYYVKVVFSYTSAFVFKNVRAGTCVANLSNYIFYFRSPPPPHRLPGKNIDTFSIYRGDDTMSKRVHANRLLPRLTKGYKQVI